MGAELRVLKAEIEPRQITAGGGYKVTAMVENCGGASGTFSINYALENDAGGIRIPASEAKTVTLQTGQTDLLSWYHSAPDVEGLFRLVIYFDGTHEEIDSWITINKPTVDRDAGTGDTVGGSQGESDQKSGSGDTGESSGTSGDPAKKELTGCEKTIGTKTVVLRYISSQIAGLTNEEARKKIFDWGEYWLKEAPECSAHITDCRKAALDTFTEAPPASIFDWEGLGKWFEVNKINLIILAVLLGVGTLIAFKGVGALKGAARKALRR